MRATSSKSNIPSVVIGSVGIAATMGISYILARKVHRSIEVNYGGLAGLLRFIWEGDHLAPHIRSSMDTLDEISDKLVGKEMKRLEKIQVSIQAAKMNSVDHEYENIVINDDSIRLSTDPVMYPKYYILAQTPSLKKELSLLSQNLDKLAAKIDEVPSYDDVHVKYQKKMLSKRVVEMMETADLFIHDCGVSITIQ